MVARATCNFSNFDLSNHKWKTPSDQTHTHTVANSQIRAGLRTCAVLYKRQTNSPKTIQSHTCTMRLFFPGVSLSAKCGLVCSFVCVSFQKVFGSFVDCLQCTECNTFVLTIPNGKICRHFYVRASLQSASVASFMSFDFMCTCVRHFFGYGRCCCLSDISIENIKCWLFLWFTQKNSSNKTKPSHTIFATVKSQQKPFGQMLQQQQQIKQTTEIMAYKSIAIVQRQRKKTLKNTKFQRHKMKVDGSAFGYYAR